MSWHVGVGQQNKCPLQEEQVSVCDSVPQGFDFEESSKYERLESVCGGGGVGGNKFMHVCVCVIHFGFQNQCVKY